MRNTFGISKIDAICFIAHNTRMTDVNVGALTGNSPEWVREVRTRMGDYDGEHIAKMYDQAFRLIDNLNHKAKELHYARFILEDGYKTHRAANFASSLLCVRFRNRSHDIALKEFEEAKAACMRHFGKIKMLYNLIPTIFFSCQTESLTIDYSAINAAMRDECKEISNARLKYFIANVGKSIEKDTSRFFEEFLNLETKHKGFTRDINISAVGGSIADALGARHLHSRQEPLVGSIGKLEVSPYAIPSIKMSRSLTTEERLELNESLGRVLGDKWFNSEA